MQVVEFCNIWLTIVEIMLCQAEWSQGVLNLFPSTRACDAGKILAGLYPGKRFR